MNPQAQRATRRAMERSKKMSAILVVGQQSDGVDLQVCKVQVPVEGEQGLSTNRSTPVHVATLSSMNHCKT